MSRVHHLRLALLSTAIAMSTIAASVASENDRQTLKKDKLGSTPNVHKFGTTLLSGQPSQVALEEAKQRGIKVIVSFREKGEVKWDAAESASDLGIEFHRLGFRAPESLDDEVFDKARKLLADTQDTPTMMYCGSANRVGAIWTAHRALDGGLSLEDALKEGQEVGLRNEDYEKIVKDYIRRSKK